MTTRASSLNLPGLAFLTFALLASALATGIATPPAWGQPPPDLSRDPVLFVHGYGDDGSIWNPLRGFLETQGYHAAFLYAITFPNPTESNKTLAENQIACEIEALLKQVNDAFPGLQKTKVDLVSHSMGGLSTRWYISQPRSAEARCDQVPPPPPPPPLGAARVDTWISLAGANHGTDRSDFCNDADTARRELCPAFIDIAAQSEDDVQLTLNGPRGFKNFNNDKDETCYGLGEDNQDHSQDQGAPLGTIPRRMSVTRTQPTATQRVFYATIRCGDETIIPNESTAVDGAGGRTIVLTDLLDDVSETSPGNFRMTNDALAANCHENIHRDPKVFQLVARLLQTNTTVVKFDFPAPEHGPGSLDGVFEGIDFGTGQWSWEGPFSWDPTNNIYFSNASGTSRTFQFSLAPRVLISMRVFSVEAEGTLTLSDDRGQTLTQVVTPGSMQPVVTNWTLPSTTVTVDFTAGWNLGIDDITYRR